MLQPLDVCTNRCGPYWESSSTSEKPSIALERNGGGSPLRRIGAGACGSVWAFSSDGPSIIAYKREDGGTSRSLANDFAMHRRLLLSLLNKPTRIQVPECHGFITSSDPWWDENAPRFPAEYLPCNMIQAQRIPPISQPVRDTLIDRYCPASLREQIRHSAENGDCLIRPYLGRRRVLANTDRKSKFKAFSLRNYPLHVDQMEELGISVHQLEAYARSMAEMLAVMHWVAGIDGNDIEFVLASPSPGSTIKTDNVLGTHAMWVLDFDLCREMPSTEDGVQQAVAAFYKNDPFYPRPRSSLLLWKAFREQYLLASAEVMVHKDWRALLPGMFIDAIERREAVAESPVLRDE